MTKAAWFRPVIFSVNCYLATILTLFIAFSLDLKSPGWAMTTIYLTSQPISGAMRAKAVYRVIGTLVGGAVMVAIVPNLVDAPELTTGAIILWVTFCLFVAQHDRTPRSYMFVLAGYTAALIGFPSVLAPGTVFDTAVSRVEEIAIGVVCAALVHSLIFPKSALSAFDAKMQSVLANARVWVADGLTKAPTPQIEMQRRSIAGDITELYLLATNLPFDTSRVRPDIGIIRAFDRKIVALLPLLTAIEDRLTVLRGLGPLPDGLARIVAAVHDWVLDKSASDPERAQSLRTAALAATPAITEQSHWADLVAANVTERLAELIDSWQASLDLAAYLADPTRRPSAAVEAPACFSRVVTRSVSPARSVADTAGSAPHGNSAITGGAQNGAAATAAITTPSATVSHSAGRRGAAAVGSCGGGAASPPGCASLPVSVMRFLPKRDRGPRPATPGSVARRPAAAATVARREPRRRRR